MSSEKCERCDGCGFEGHGSACDRDCTCKTGGAYSFRGFHHNRGCPCRNCPDCGGSGEKQPETEANSVTPPPTEGGINPIPKADSFGDCPDCTNKHHTYEPCPTPTEPEGAGPKLPDSCYPSPEARRAVADCTEGPRIFRIGDVLGGWNLNTIERVEIANAGCQVGDAGQATHPNGPDVMAADQNDNNKENQNANDTERFQAAEAADGNETVPSGAMASPTQPQATGEPADEVGRESPRVVATKPVLSSEGRFFVGEAEVNCDNSVFYERGDELVWIVDSKDHAAIAEKLNAILAATLEAHPVPEDDKEAGTGTENGLTQGQSERDKPVEVSEPSAADVRVHRAEVSKSWGDRAIMLTDPDRIEKFPVGSPGTELEFAL